MSRNHLLCDLRSADQLETFAFSGSKQVNSLVTACVMTIVSAIEEEKEKWAIWSDPNKAVYHWVIP